MNRYIFGSAAAVAFLIIAAVVVSAQVLPRVFVLDAKGLVATRQKLGDPKAADPALKAAVAKLDRDAQKALKAEVLPVTTKTALPPSGDKHDYMSQAPYFWKDPNTKDGFPYIKKDGERNPEIKNFPDHDLMESMRKAVDSLAYAYYFTGNEEYAARAAEILRMWFLDPKTKMNPNLEFAQAIPGQASGRNFGIIEVRSLTNVVDSIGLLAGSRSWTKADQDGLKTWFSNFLDWLVTSKNGIDEGKAKNNHGTHYDGRVASFALFVGRNDLAKKVIESVKQNRIAKQIEPDGEQPLELARTKSWSYSTMNLEGMVTLAELGDDVGVDLWHFQTSDGRSIRKAIDFLYPYAIGDKKWTYKQIEAFDPEKLYETMRRAQGKYKDDAYVKMMSRIPKLEPGSSDYLLTN